MTTAESPVAWLRSTDPLSAEVDGEVVMLDPATSRYFGLAETGARIWELLAEPRTIDELVTLLTAEYVVDDATCRNQVGQFVETLRAAGLAHAVPPGDGALEAP